MSFSSSPRRATLPTSQDRRPPAALCPNRRKTVKYCSVSGLLTVLEAFLRIHYVGRLTIVSAGFLGSFILLKSDRRQDLHNMNEVQLHATNEPARTQAVRVAVVEMDWGWRLFLNGEGIGRFGDRARAMRCALDVARETRTEGCEVEVLTHDRFGEIHAAEARGSTGRDPADGVPA